MMRGPRKIKRDKSKPGLSDWEPFGAFFQKLRQSADTKQVLERLLNGLVKMLSASRGFVLLAEPSSKELVTVASYRFEDSEEFERLSNTVSKRALDTGEVICIEESADEDWFSEASQESMALLPRSILCAPLIARAENFGVVYIDGHQGRTKIDQSRKAFFQVVVTMAAELIAAAQTRQHLLDTRDKMEAYKKLVSQDSGFIMGSSSAARELDSMLDAAAEQDVSVLITGSTGTGKEMVARDLHRRSKRRNGPFIAVNCAALPREIIEAELFGSEKGAFTGATERRIGRFELASGGTLFLDEIGELDGSIQVKLLRVLQERQVRRLGGQQSLPLDFRLISATNRDLEKDLREGHFRQDLYYRVNVFRMHLKPLCERVEDIMPLAEHFRGLFASRFSKEVLSFTEEAKEEMLSHRWPGNVRELRNAIERAVVIEQGRQVTSKSLPFARVSTMTSGGNLSEFLDRLPKKYEEAKEAVERAYVERHYAKHSGNIAAFSRETGIPRNTLYRRLARYGIGDRKS